MAGGGSRNKVRRCAPAGEVGEASGGSGGTGWSDLPDVLLLVIFGLIISVTDHYAFAGVCRSWRSVAQSEDARKSLANRPPLLLRPVQPDLRLRPRLRPVQPDLPLRPRLPLISPIGDFPTSTLSLFPTSTIWSISDLLAYFAYRLLPREPLSEFSCIMSPSSLSQSFIGYGHGNLIFLTRRWKVLIASVFVHRRELLSPQVPRDAQGCNRGFLTAPPSSRETSSWLLLSGPDTGLICWRVGSRDWLRPLTGRIAPPIKQVVAFDGKLYALDSSETIWVIKFSPDHLISVEPFEFQFVKRGVGTPFRLSSFGQQLVAYGEKLLMVCSVEMGTVFHVYCLDREEGDWVRLHSLQGRCLFLDYAGRCPVVCTDPSRWGVLSNCIYVADPGIDDWKVYKVSAVRSSCYSEMTLDPYTGSVLQQYWPSPIWVSPSMLP